MKIKERAQLLGTVKLQLFGPDGKLKTSRLVRNLVVDAGLAWIAGRLRADVDIPTAMGWIALGDDSTAAAAGQTALVGSELGRKAFDSDPSLATATVTYTATFSPGEATGAIVECGILNAAAVGTMLCRTTFSVVNKAAGDTMVVTWDLAIDRP